MAPVGGPDDGTWVVTVLAAEMLAENSAYRLAIDRRGVRQETTFRTGRQQGKPTGDVDPSLEIEQVGAPLSSTDPCDWRETTPVTLTVDPGDRAPNGILLVLRGDADNASADAEVVWAGPAAGPTEVALRVENDPARTCFAASIDTLSGTSVTGPGICADVPAAPSYEEDRANGKTSGGHGCATAPGSLGLRLFAGLLVRRRRRIA